MKEKTIYFGGTILTCDPLCPTVEAILTEDGVIAEVGAKDAITALCPDAKKINLEGKNK